ncbi:MAG: hypothetical protein HOP10_06110 [Chitinophagaceae bacterium]|nr:hypothetical protein [Chitinophagaceae bacterium]
MKSNIDHIKKITGAIDINDQQQVLLNNIPTGNYTGDEYAAKPSGKMLFDKLQQIIYSKFYIQPCKPLSDQAPTQAGLEKNISILSKANKTVEQFDEGWTVEKNDESVSLLAKKGNKLIRLKAGEYLNIPKGNNADEPAGVRIYRPKEYSSVTDVFYYGYGSAIDENGESEMVRFYFNSTFEGNRKWMQLLTGFANEFAVPFIFKCLVHPFYYGRCDTAVLYCDKQYAGFVYDFIDSVYAAVKKDMRSSTPLFTYPLKKEIGFAEQPPNETESFGSHWSKIIAAGMMKAFEADAAKEKWFDAVMEHITVNHRYPDPEKLYRNPGSRYPYYFINEK